MRLQAAGDDQDLAGYPASVVRGKKHRDGCDVARLPCAAEWCLLHRLLFEVAADDACRTIAFGVDHAWIDRVYADLSRAQFLGEHPRDNVHGAFRGGIDWWYPPSASEIGALCEIARPATGRRVACDAFPLSLRFETAGTVETTVTVKAAGAGAAMDMGAPATTCST
jgi:hypothetical protein